MPRTYRRGFSNAKPGNAIILAENNGQLTGVIASWQYSTAIAEADPGDGFVRFNHATIALATEIYIDDLDGQDNDLSVSLQALTAGSKLMFRAANAPGETALFNVSSVSNEAGYTKIVVTLEAGAPTWQNFETLALIWSVAGPQGVKGDPGNDGIDGADGVDGKFSGTEVIKTSAYTALAADVGKTIVLSKATADTLSFEPAATLGSDWMVMVKNIGAGTWTLDPDSAETIDGAATVALAQNESIVVSSNGTELRTFFRGSGGGSGGSGLVADRTALAAMTPSNGDTAYVAEDNVHGLFRFSSADLSAKVAADTLEGIYVAPDSDATGASGAWVRQYDGPVSVRWFDPVADGSTDDKAVIHAARDMAISEGRGLHFPSGNYGASDLAFATARMRITFDPNVELFHLGTGVFITIGTNPGGYREVYFGWGCPPVITGNINTTDLVQIFNCHESYFDVICRECVTGVRASFCILSHFNVHCSTNSGEISVLVPDHALYMTGHDVAAPCVACQVYVLAEGLQDYGLYLDNAQYCEILGVAEGNAGGVYAETTSVGNSFRGFYTEACTTLNSLIKGGRNVLDNCSAHGDMWTIEGSYCRITGGFYSDFTIATGATDNTIEGTYVINGLVDNGTRTYKRNTGQVGVTGTVRPTITGAKGGNAALTSLLTQLAAYGFIIDNTTA